MAFACDLALALACGFAFTALAALTVWPGLLFLILLVLALSAVTVVFAATGLFLPGLPGLLGFAAVFALAVAGLVLALILVLILAWRLP